MHIQDHRTGESTLDNKKVTVIQPGRPPIMPLPGTTVTSHKNTAANSKKNIVTIENSQERGSAKNSALHLDLQENSVSITHPSKEGTIMKQPSQPLANPSSKNVHRYAQPVENSREDEKIKMIREESNRDSSRRDNGISSSQLHF